MRVWIKLIKHFQGGSKTDYMFVNEKAIETEAQQKELMEDWGENSDGGHAYGYRVEMHTLEEGETVPKEWLEKKIVSTEEGIKYMRKQVLKAEEALKIYKEQLLNY
jgi:hypothetical protein